MSYDPAVALDFFRAAGKPTRVARSSVIFAEKENAGLFRRSKIYLLLDGEVGLVAGGKAIGTVKRGEIFGELAAFTHAPRSATAVAHADCIVIALDDKQFEAELQKQPGFALMLMSMLIGRLRETVSRLTASGALSEAAALEESAAFDPKRLTELVSGLSNDPPLYYQQGRQVLSEGSKAALMYAVIKGRVAVSIGGSVVERLGPGGAFGEAALIDQAPRLATAVAETDCELLPITRPAFMALVKTNAQFAYAMVSTLAARLRYLTERLK